MDRIGMSFPKLLGFFRGVSSPAALDLISAKKCPSSTLAMAMGQTRPSSPSTYCHVDMTIVDPPIRALLVDAAGTLVSPSEKAAHVYQRFGKPYGVQLSEPEILHRFRMCVSMNPWDIWHGAWDALISYVMSQTH